MVEHQAKSNCHVKTKNVIVEEMANFDLFDLMYLRLFIDKTMCIRKTGNKKSPDHKV